MRQNGITCTQNDSTSSSASATSICTTPEDGREVSSETKKAIAIQGALDDAYAWRDYNMECDGSTHHFNWLGQPIWERSSTSPAASLVFMQGKPKTAWALEDFRVQSVLNRAIRFVDPVAVVLEDGDASFLELEGTALEKAATGRVYKFYSPPRPVDGRRRGRNRRDDAGPREPPHVHIGQPGDWQRIHLQQSNQDIVRLVPRWRFGCL